VSPGPAQPGRPVRPAPAEPPSRPEPTFGAPAEPASAGARESASPGVRRPASASAAAAGREVFRLAPPVVFWWVWVAFAVANVADFAIQGASARFAAVVTAILMTVTGLAYALALRPKVAADETGVTVVNPFRLHHVPWSLIQAVDTGDWVRIHYAPAGGAPSSAKAKVVYCWALYVSARTKRKTARLTRRPERYGMPRQGGLFRFQTPGWLAGQQGNAEDSRLPEEARYLASLPVTKAIAVRLDTRAEKERARAADAAPAGVTARWMWLPAAAIAVPALALLIIALL